MIDIVEIIDFGGMALPASLFCYTTSEKNMRERLELDKDIALWCKDIFGYIPEIVCSSISEYKKTHIRFRTESDKIIFKIKTANTFIRLYRNISSSDVWYLEYVNNYELALIERI